MRLIIGIAISMASACSGPAPNVPPTAPAPALAPSPAAAPPMAASARLPVAAPSAAAPPSAPPAVVPGRSGRCEAGEESTADDGQQGGFGFSIEVRDGKITKAHYFVSSGMGAQIGDLSGPSGPAVRDGEWLDLPVEVEAPHGPDRKSVV
jgi:hypothetical protein